jgi:exonuclease III
LEDFCSKVNQFDNLPINIVNEGYCSLTSFSHVYFIATGTFHSILEDFCSKVNQFDNLPMIVGGDWNMVMDKIDKKGGPWY